MFRFPTVTRDIIISMKKLSFILVLILGLGMATDTTKAQNSTDSPQLSVIVESDTYVPYFYEGRREPSPGNTIRLVVVASDMPTVANYNWQIGDQYLTTQTPYTSVQAPLLNDNVLVKVKAFDSVGRILAEHQEYITLSTPHVLFYENSLLYGHSQKALGDETQLVGEELSLRAEPYFFGSQSLLSENTGRWTSDKMQVDTSSSDWRMANFIKLEQENIVEEGKVKVRLELIPNNNNLSQQIYGDLIINI